jgi:hypothetical protein
MRSIASQIDVLNAATMVPIRVSSIEKTGGA